jgi:polyribonucleotide nucleotidyltransferase
MREALEKPRAELSPYAPRVRDDQDPDREDPRDHRPRRQGHPGHQEQTAAKIDVEDDGRVTVFSPDNASVQKALGMIQDICREVELDGSTSARSRRSSSSAPSSRSSQHRGLLHISQIAESRIRPVQDVLTEGDEVLSRSSRSTATARCG